MDEYPKYPIYNGSVTYHRELMDYDLRSCQCPSFAKRCEGLPRHRIRGHSDWSGWIYRKDPGLDVVRERLAEVWKNYLLNPKSNGFVPVDPRDVELIIERQEPEEWVLTWFCHQTPDVDQSNQEVLESFENFLTRKGVRLNYGYDPYNCSGSQHDDYCAMGAEDRWRWSGVSGENGERTDPPCRCDGCKKAGMVRINH